MSQSKGRRIASGSGSRGSGNAVPTHDSNVVIHACMHACKIATTQPIEFTGVSHCRTTLYTIHLVDVARSAGVCRCMRLGEGGERRGSTRRSGGLSGQCTHACLNCNRDYKNFVERAWAILMSCTYTIAWAICECALIRFSTLWLHPFTVVLHGESNRGQASPRVLSLGVCENRDGWLVAWGLCGCMPIRFPAVWLLPFTLL